ncbi:MULTISPECIES: hypothetical protein [Pseudomonas syringae group]|uniref:hypothetical protein n=1 Tax=Pseudomonas syringae group TaxID=136849 RepID=UPI000F02D838|nr:MULTISPECIES: hypothetical protein [Pseudomonas syringae group]MCZ0945904.1 hypothetical protein [Pseudomonas syringae pv. tomato]
MSLKALIDLANRQTVEDSPARDRRNQESYARVNQYGKQVEQRIASKAVSQELLAKACSL